ncbi:MAG: AAA family ATPase [Deltaproteobacteria bacterium]|nr:AAA family ATPase [Deltaproteobacteria bacterium]
MITALRLGNFKAFAEAQNIPIKPITLIFGANSAGKSSIIHSLALAHEAMRTGELDLFRTDLGGSSIDLGGFRQYIHRRQANRRMEWGMTLRTKKFTGRLKELLKPVGEITVNITTGMPLDDQDEPLPGAVPHVISYELESDGSTLLRMSRRPGNQMALDLLPYKHPVLRRIISALIEIHTTTGTVSEEDLSALEKPIEGIIAGLRASMGAFFPKGLKDRSREEEGDSTKPPGFFPVSKGYRQEDLAKALRIFLPRTLDELIEKLNSVLRLEINRLQYLGPLRSYPARHFAFAEHEDINWYAGGGYAWDVVRRNKEVRDKVNSWLCDTKKLSTPYELSIKNLLTIDDLDTDYQEIVEQIERAHVDGDHDRLGGNTEEGVYGDLFGTLYSALDEIKKKETNLASIQELVLLDRRTDTQVSQRDVGIGISQVLPILVSAYASREKIIAIEQPEIHLHPALQAELGDVFIESALAGNDNTFLLETHSEHLLLRVMRRMRETTSGKLPNGLPSVRPEDVMVLFVEPVGSRSIIHEMPLNKRGDLVKEWPGGFFEEDFEELF